ncbi:hypothetical protein [Clostridium intestinale]|uniref:hypothetical protein n=1 Tax=Clostridium intestinale TaxID=36845 RepID=UPI001A9B1E9C|nr:hypothetical protein [Clostridium intestinale]
MLSFWELTLKEIQDSISAYQKRILRDAKNRAFMDYKLAECIGINVAAILSKDSQPVPFIEVYRDLYKEEYEEFENQKINQEAIIHKQRMLDFANFHNSNRKGVS